MDAVLREDQGRTGAPRVMRQDDAADRDIGSPRAVQRADGIVLTAYCYNDAKSPERYIAATPWKP